ncbi:hypothetical protein [Microbacterium sp. GXF7504]
MTGATPDLERYLAAVEHRLRSRPTRTVEPEDVELAVFTVLDREALALDAWHAARVVGDAVRPAVARLLRERFGNRNPLRGWTVLLCVPQLLAAAFGAAIALGVAPAPGWVAALLLALAGGCDLAALLGTRFRPRHRLTFRNETAATVLVALATAAGVAEGEPAVAVSGGVALVIAAASLIALAVCRRRDPEGANALNAALPTATLDVAPQVRAGEARVLAELAARLPDDVAALAVRIRTAALARERAAGRAVAPVDESAPAGGFIVARLARTTLRPPAGEVAD